MSELSGAVWARSLADLAGAATVTGRPEESGRPDQRSAVLKTAVEARLPGLLIAVTSWCYKPDSHWCYKPNSHTHQVPDTGSHTQQ